MAREIGKLSALAVGKIKTKGLYPDGGNLYLQVSESGSKSWIFRYMLHGKAKTMGLGALHSLGLGDARTKAADCRKLLTMGEDPLTNKKNSQYKAKLAAAKAITFEKCAISYIETHQGSWKNEKHKQQWENTLATYAYPVFGKLPVQDIDTDLVLKVIEPLWSTKTETANRIRGRIECILNWAKVKGYREGENPALWRGHLQNSLPARLKIQKVEHHSALPYPKMSEFIKKLHAEEGLSAKALELIILTATRTSEVINARWVEFDLKNKTWTIPANRIKAGKEHRIPLSAPALKILKELEKLKRCEYVFSNNKDNPISNMAMLSLLRRMKVTDITVHGFRSTFRDWASEVADCPNEVAEAALAHAIGNKVEAAYRRGDLFDKRRQLMTEWADYCYKTKSKKTKKA